MNEITLTLEQWKGLDLSDCADVRLWQRHWVHLLTEYEEDGYGPSHTAYFGKDWFPYVKQKVEDAYGSNNKQ